MENGNWTPVTQGFVVVNEGNTNVTLDLKTGKTVAGFLGGTNPIYQYNLWDHYYKKQTSLIHF